jgi:hypothetical protein
MSMKQLVALALSIAVLGAIWAYIALGPLSGDVLVWAGFIAWGCYFQSGADSKALTRTIAGTCYGALIGWMVLLLLVNTSVPALGVAWPAILVGLTLFLLVIAASIDLLSMVAANIYGYAAIVAYSLHQPSAQPGIGPLRNLTSGSIANPLILLIASLVLGALFGLFSGKLAGALTRNTDA